jgi:hypothetical protein
MDRNTAIALLTALSIALTVAACGDSTPPEPEPADRQTERANANDGSDEAASANDEADSAREEADSADDDANGPADGSAPQADSLETGDVELLVALGRVRGHLRAARALYEDERPVAAERQLQTPREAMDGDVAAALDARGFESFGETFSELAGRIDDRADAGEVVAAWLTVDGAIETIERDVAATPKQELEVVARLLEHTHERYRSAMGNGVGSGVVENEADYHASWGLQHVALERVGQIVATSDVERSATAEAGVAVSSLSDLWPTLTPVMEIDADAERIAAAAERIRGIADEIG